MLKMIWGFAGYSFLMFCFVTQLCVVPKSNFLRNTGVPLPRFIGGGGGGGGAIGNFRGSHQHGKTEIIFLKASYCILSVNFFCLLRNFRSIILAKSQTGPFIHLFRGDSRFFLAVCSLSQFSVQFRMLNPFSQVAVYRQSFLKFLLFSKFQNHSK